MIPCENCILLPMCKHKTTVKCEIIERYIVKFEKSHHRVDYYQMLYCVKQLLKQTKYITTNQISKEGNKSKVIIISNKPY